MSTLWRILYTWTISARSLRYSSVGKPYAFNLSGYDNYLRHSTRRVARLWSFSNILLSFFVLRRPNLCSVFDKWTNDRLVKVEKHFLVHIRKRSEYNPKVSVFLVYSKGFCFPCLLSVLYVRDNLVFRLQWLPNLFLISPFQFVSYFHPNPFRSYLCHCFLKYMYEHDGISYYRTTFSKYEPKFLTYQHRSVEVGEFLVILSDSKSWCRSLANTLYLHKSLYYLRQVIYEDQKQNRPQDTALGHRRLSLSNLSMIL